MVKSERTNDLDVAIHLLMTNSSLTFQQMNRMENGVYNVESYAVCLYSLYAKYMPSSGPWLPNAISIDRHTHATIIINPIPGIRIMLC